MSEKKYDYLKQEWDKFYTEINVDLKKKTDGCFEEFVKKIEKGLTLDDYAVEDIDGCSYLCNYIERVSAEMYGSARPGNMYNYGISLIGEKKEEGKFFINRSLLASDAQGEKYKKEKKKEITIYDKEIAKESFNEISGYLKSLINETIDDELPDVIKNIEDTTTPINATHLLRKLVAMNNKGKFLFAYADDAINTIYEFFVDKNHTTNIEKNFEATKTLKNLFPKKDNEEDSVYMIRLSRFIWGIFGSSISIESKNMILHGAPGTGKTYSIKNTVKNMILKNGGNIDEQLVFTQFHPSYSYEDFIDGIKPNGIDEKTGQLKFELKNGLFKELCRTATKKLEEERKKKKKDEDLTKYFFVADEINRAELSRVFGELLITLEDDYRIDFDNGGNIKNHESLITLQNASLDNNPVYENEYKKYFGVPKNLYFIGTMNDIDRSVESFDMALRRRFYWKEIRCNYDFIDSKFNNQDYTTICKYLNRFITGYKEEKTNGKIEKIEKVKGYQSLGLGVSFELGHAYFKDIKSFDNKGINILWDSKIEPLLKEYLRSEYSADEIYHKLIEAKAIFTLPKKDNLNDSNS